jgi:hypothetical protein
MARWGEALRTSRVPTAAGDAESPAERGLPGDREVANRRAVGSAPADFDGGTAFFPALEKKVWPRLTRFDALHRRHAPGAVLRPPCAPQAND